MRDKAALYRMFEEKLREIGSSLEEILNNPDLKIPVPPEAGQAGRYYHVIKSFALVVRSDTGEPMASVPTATALLTLLRYAPEDAQPLIEYTRNMGQSSIRTLGRKDVYYPLDLDLAHPHYVQQYTDPMNTVWAICRDTKGRAVVMRGSDEVGRYLTVDAAEDDHELPMAVVSLCDEVLA
jgi:hypothetical protein